jgi:Cu/Ag efflux protein CusF
MVVGLLGRAAADRPNSKGEGMTMVFRASDPAMLEQVKAGDKIRFDAENINGQYTVTKIEKKK